MDFTSSCSIILLVFVTIFIQNCFCIKCFQCNSYEDPDCSTLTVNSTDSPYYQECKPYQNITSFFCRKTTQTILDKDDFFRVIRGCGWLVHKEKVDLCRKEDTDFKLQTTCQCFDDGCNTGTIPHTTALLSLLPCTVMFFYNRLF